MGLVEQQPPRTHEARIDAGLGPRSTGPGLALEVHAADPSLEQPRHVLGTHASRRDHTCRERRIVCGMPQQVVDPGRGARERAGRVDAVDSRNCPQLPPGSPRVERGVERTVERPRGTDQRVGKDRTDLGVDVEVAGQEAEHAPLGAQAEEVAGEPRQPGQLATLRAQPLGQPQRHPNRQIRGPYDRADRTWFEGALLTIDDGTGMDPVGATGLGGLGIGGMQADDLERHLASSRRVHEPSLPAGPPRIREACGSEAGSSTCPGCDDGEVTADDPLLSARALVLSDLAWQGLVEPHTVSLLEDSVAQRRWWLEQWRAGAAFVTGLVAQDVQDALLDESTRWPLCTQCPDPVEHSLAIEPELGPDPRWVCSESGVEIAPLGQLSDRVPGLPIWRPRAEDL